MATLAEKVNDLERAKEVAEASFRIFPLLKAELVCKNAIRVTFCTDALDYFWKTLGVLRTKHTGWGEIENVANQVTYVAGEVLPKEVYSTIYQSHR